MNWEMIATIVEILSLLAIFVSIVFVGRQFRQTSEQNLLSCYIQTTERFSSCKENADVIIKGHSTPELLTPTESFQFTAFMVDMLSALALVWEQSHDDLVSHKTYKRAIMVASFHFAQPGFQMLLRGELPGLPDSNGDLYETWDKRGIPKTLLLELEAFAIREFGWDATKAAEMNQSQSNGERQQWSGRDVVMDPDTTFQTS